MIDDLRQLKPDFVVIGVVKYGEFAAERLEFFHVEVGGDTSFAFSFGDDTSVGVDNHAVAAVLA